MPDKVDRHALRRDILKLLKNNGHKAYRAKEIARQLNLHGNRYYRAFRDVLAEMEARGHVAKIKGGRYTYQRTKPMQMEGRLIVNPQGFGFVVVEGQEQDFFVRASRMNTALDGDTVKIGLFAPARGDQRREAEIVQVLERGRKQAVGTLEHHGHFAFVRPDDQKLTHDIYVAQEDFNGAKEGDKVVVSIDAFEDPHASPSGRVLDVIGRADDPRVAVLAVALSHDVRVGFPQEVIEQAENIPVEIPESELQRRRDLRQERIFTIDPIDAKDFDDAIHVRELENGNYEVGVHIADVSHYVPEGSGLDEEAFARATSVYLVDRVIPMLPEKLSNGVCSLRPREDKLCFSCIMEITPRGKVVKYDIVETVIHSMERFTYEQAQAILEGKLDNHPLAEDVKRAGDLAAALTKKRMREGSIDFDRPEIRVILDDTHKPVDFKRKLRQASNRLIEEFMLLANRTVAQHVGGKKSSARPFVYRIHDKPDAEQIQQLAEYVRVFGYELPLTEGTATPQALNKLLRRVEGTPEERVIEEAALRSMAKAVYSTKNIGHYGLGFSHYSHFTSPIRRYPDLIAHRLLKRYATGANVPGQDQLEKACIHCSERERDADEAQRESVRLKQVEYMRDHVGETFDGVVSGVTKFGVFVELAGVFIEGLVHVRDMDDDYYEYDERRYALVGQYTRHTFRLGDAVTVQVVRAEVDTRQIDLLFVD